MRASLSLGQTLLVHGLILAHGDGVIMVWSSPVPQGCVRFEGRACDCERGTGKATHILLDAWFKSHPLCNARSCLSDSRQTLKLEPPWFHGYFCI